MTASPRLPASRRLAIATLFALLGGLPFTTWARTRIIDSKHPDSASASNYVPYSPEAPVPPEILDILSFAEAQLGSVDFSRIEEGEPVGRRYLKDLFEEMTGTRLSNSDLRSSWTPLGKSWCAIWAFWVYREVQELDLKWDLREGRPKGNFLVFPSWGFASRKKYESLVRPGDIFGIAKRNHHGIVESIAPDGSLVTLEANLTWGRIQRLTHRKLSDIVTFYRPLP